MKALNIDEGILNIKLEGYPDYEAFIEDDDLRIWGEKILLLCARYTGMNKYIMGFINKYYKK